MIRLVYVILISAPIVLFYLLKSYYVVNSRVNYSEEQRYTMVKHMISIMKFNGRIKTKVYGMENLPADGGYVMYPNHQGKYDVLGIIGAHDTPCTFVIDKKRSWLPFAKEVAIIDSYKVFGVNSLKKIKTQVHFLEPIYYDEYKELPTKEIAGMVQQKIENVIEQYS